MTGVLQDVTHGEHTVVWRFSFHKQTKDIYGSQRKWVDVCTQTDPTGFFQVLTILGSPVSTWGWIYTNRDTHLCRRFDSFSIRSRDCLNICVPLKVFNESTFKSVNCFLISIYAVPFWRTIPWGKRKNTFQSFTVFAVWFLCLCTFLTESWVTAELFPQTCPCLRGTCSWRLLLNWRLNKSWRTFN